MIKFRIATRNDNKQLLELTSDAGMGGDIALRIDRNPDFFTLTEMRGKSRVYIAEEDNSIVGSLTVSLQNVYVGGQLIPVHYIGDFKVATSHRNQGIGLNLTNTVANYLIEIDADLVFLNVSKGNAQPFSFFKDRSVGTDFESVGIFNIYQLIGKKRKVDNSNFTIGTEHVSDEVISFFDEKYKKYELGTHITKEKIQGTSICTIRNNNELLAAMCLIDTMNVKQNVVTRISRKTNVMLKSVNAVSRLLGISKMPVLDEPVTMIYIKYLAVKNDDKSLLRMLVSRARNIAYGKSYSFVSIGLHEKDSLNTHFSGMFKFTFQSVGMLSSLKRSTDLVNSIKNGVPFEDYSLV